MAMVLQPNEHVFFPQPYLPQDAHELVITSLRMVRVTDAGVAEFPVNQIQYVGRETERPSLWIGLLVLLMAQVPAPQPLVAAPVVFVAPVKPVGVVRLLIFMYEKSRPM